MKIDVKNIEESESSACAKTTRTINCRESSFENCRFVKKHANR